jgi:hypothetical protein
MVLHLFKCTLAELQSEKATKFIALIESIVRDGDILCSDAVGGINLIVIEGLPSSGKSTLCQYLNTAVKDIKFIDVPQTVTDMIECSKGLKEKSLVAAIRFAANYCILYGIVGIREVESIEDVPNTVVLESYYHATVSDAIREIIDSEDRILSLPPSTFQWPIDLPQPKLVGF